MVNEKDVIELNKNYDTSGKCMARIFNLCIIPTIIYSIIIFGYFNIIKFNVEIHSVVLIGMIYVIYLTFIRHNAYFASCKFRKQYPKLKEQLKIYINKNSLEIDDITKANASITDFLHEFTLKLRNTNFSSVASGIFPTLGILGTFISIAVSMPDFSSQSSAALEKEISLLLGGVGTAFYVSIYGIFLSIWWIFFEKLGMSRFERDVIIIKENTKLFFWNKIDIDKIHFQKSIANYEKMNSVFSSMNSDQLVNNINNVLEAKVDIFEKMIDIEQKAMKKSMKHLEQREILQDKFLKAYGQISNDMQNLSHNMAVVVASLTTMTKNISTNEESMDYISKELNKHIETLNISLENISTSKVANMYDSVVNNIKQMKIDTSDISLKLQDDLNSYDKNITHKLSNSLEMIDKETSNIINKLNTFK